MRFTFLTQSSKPFNFSPIIVIGLYGKFTQYGYMVTCRQRQQQLFSFELRIDLIPGDPEEQQKAAGVFLISTENVWYLQLFINRQTGVHFPDYIRIK